MTGTCTVEGCAEPLRCTGFCAIHYDRWRRHGAAADMTPGRLHKAHLPLRLSFDSSGGPDACWPWTGSMGRYGYGRWVSGGVTQQAHRAVYELLIGPIPDGLDLDHMCHNKDPLCPGGVTCLHRRCCNPSHLMPDARGPNILRGKTLSGRNAAKVECIHGHPFDEANTYVSPTTGQRTCRACGRERAAAARAALNPTAALDAAASREARKARRCSVPGCDRDWSSKGYCAMHAERVRRNGTPGGPDPMRVRRRAS